MPRRRFRYQAGERKVEFLSCPVQASLRILGREWAFLVLTAIALFRANRFNDMLRAMPGLSKRLLTMRLTELEGAGFIVRAETRRAYVRWELTEKGADVVPILLTMVRFGSRWYADEIFADGSARDLGEIFDEGYIRKTLGVAGGRAAGVPAASEVSRQAAGRPPPRPAGDGPAPRRVGGQSPLRPREESRREARSDRPGPPWAARPGPGRASGSASIPSRRTRRALRSPRGR